MMLTEIEARKRWCPFARKGMLGTGGNNRKPNGEPDPGAMCIAMDCMAWRWSEHKRDNGCCGLVVQH